jgi:nucleoid DNA-binding protein
MNKRMKKAQIMAEMAESMEINKKTAALFFKKLQDLIKQQLSRSGPGEFIIPGIIKLKAVKKPATKEREIINPFTKQPMTVKAKPASKKVKSTALKALKDLIY